MLSTTTRPVGPFSLAKLILCAVLLAPAPLMLGQVSVTGAVSPSSVTSPTWTIGSSLFVGLDGDGTINIETGGTVSNTTGLLAVNSGSTGTVTVNGAGSIWNNSSDLYVGTDGDGTLSIENGGKVSNKFGYIGYNASSTGTVTVTGAGSTWNNSGTLFVGESGTGTLSIQAGGTVSNSLGYLGNAAGSTGTATVTGAGSTWTNSLRLYVGFDGAGTLTIKDGGKVSSGPGYIGDNSSGTGTVTVTGAGSTWTNNGFLFVGLEGTGTLTIENGGKVRDLSGSIGYHTGSTGTVTVTGAGSTWTNSGTLTVGGDGAGTLNIGAYDLSGAAGTVTATGIAGHGTINFNQTDATTFTTPIGGAVTVNQRGSGTTTLTGANTYTGATTVSAGTLRVNGSLGATAVTVASGGALGGTGTIAGGVTVANGGIFAPGNSPGTLTVGSLTLSSGSILNYELSTPGVVGGGVNDLTIVTGALTLDGTINVTDAGGFADGVYRLFNYGGLFTDHGLDIGPLPGDFYATLQTDVPGQVNLLVESHQYWDGANTTANGAVAGGDGTWNATATNWTGSNGSHNNAWHGHKAVFGGAAGTVTLGDPIGFQELQFITTGYTIAGSGANTLVPTGAAVLRTDPGVTATIAAPLTGAGSITKTDTGTLVLTGDNTYTGGTTISEGTLQLGNGGTSGSVAGDITDNAALAFNRSDDFTYTGVISGSGTLIKLGAGALTLTGANPFTGLTSINAGTLKLAAGSSLADVQVAPGGTLQGLGAVRGSLANAGTVSPGFSPGTLTVAGDFTQDATGRLRIELVSPGSYDRLVVGGTAALGGTLEVAMLPGFTPAAGQQFPVLTAAKLTGAFATMSLSAGALPVALDLGADYTTGGVKLAFNQVPYATFAQSPNQAAIAAGLDSAVAAGRAPALQAEFNSYLSASAIRHGLDQLSPGRYLRWFKAALFNAAALERAVDDNLAPSAPAAPNRHAWAQVVRREADFDGGAGLAGARLDTNGLIVGLHRTGAPGIAFGGLLSYMDNSLNEDAGSGSTDIETFQPAIYGRYTAGPWSTVALGGWAWHDYTARRAVALPGYAQTARGKTDGTDAFASVRTTYDLHYDQVELTPFALLQYMNWSADGFQEQGAGEAGLRVAGQHGDSFASQLGLGLTRSFQKDGVHLTPAITAAWRHELDSGRRSLAAALAGSDFSVRGPDAPDDGWVASVGLDAQLRDNLVLYARVGSEGDTAVTRAYDFNLGANCRF